MQQGIARSPNANSIGIPHLRPNNVSSNGELNLLEIKYIYADSKEINKYGVTKGDIIFNNTNSLDLVGKTAFFDLDEHYLISNHLTRIRVDENQVNPEFLAFYLHYLWLIGITRRGAKQWVNQASIDLSKSKFQIQIPSLIEQKQIASVLMKVKNLRLIASNAYDKAQCLPSALYIEMFGNPIDNPKRWAKSKLGELGRWQSGGTPPRKNRENFEGDIPWFSSGELGEIYIKKSKECISRDAIKKSSAKLVSPGSLLLGLYDTAALKSSISDSYCSCNQAIAFSKLDASKVDAIFVYYTIQLGKDYFKRFQRGVRQKNLNLSMIKEISIPIPPLSRQIEYREKTLKLIDNIEYFSSLSHLIDMLFKSILEQAFSGELTKNWRTRVTNEMVPDKTIENGLKSAIKLLRKVFHGNEMTRMSNDMQILFIKILKPIIKSRHIIRANLVEGALSTSQILIRLLMDELVSEDKRIFQAKALISKIPNEDHPRKCLLNELSNLQYQVYLATILALDEYLTPDNLADNNDIPLISIYSELELLDSLGLIILVDLPVKIRDSIGPYIPIYRSLNYEIDDSKLDDLKILKEVSQ